MGVDEKAEQNISIQEEVLNLPYYNTPDFEPLWSIDHMDSIHRIGEFQFIDQNGQEVTAITFDNSIYVTNFFFTACGSICPKMIKNMEKLQNSFINNDEVMFISHSVMPWMDDVKSLKEYTGNFEVNDEQWKFVTGDKSEIYTLARKSYFVEEDPGYDKDSTEFLHTEHFVLIDKEKRVRGIYNGTVELEMDRIIEDIELLLKE